MSFVSLGECVPCFYHVEASTLILYATQLYRMIHIRALGRTEQTGDRMLWNTWVLLTGSD